MITTNQIKIIQTQLSRRFGDREERLEFLSQLTGDAINSTKELTALQASNIIRYLNTGESSQNAHYARFDKNKAQHRTILSLCIQFGWRAENGYTDLERLGTWLISSRCPVRKPLMKMTVKEVSKVITALENMVNKRYECIKRN